MSSDSDRVPKPSKRRRIIIPDSESSNESIVFQTHRRRKVYRVVSEAESSEEDSDVPRPVIRRKNYKVVSEDDKSYDSNASEAAESETSSEWQSDWDSMDELEEENEASPLKSKLKKKRIKPTDSTKLATTSGAGFESDSSDGQSEKCPICLLSFKKQQLGTPSSCDHCFCLDCLIEWSKNINTCPVDRQAFTVIHVKSKVDGKVLKHIPIEVKPRIEDQIQEDPTYCEICQQCDREDRMLLCDGCDLGYHLECLTPQMEQVPMDEWYCPECSQNSQNDAEMVEIDLDEIPDLMEEARRLGLSYGRTRTGHPHENGPSTISRVIPRTRQTERVRANIRADRTRAREVQDREVRERALVFDPDQPSTSSGIDSIGRNSPSHSRDSNRSSTESRVGPSVSSSTSLRAGTRTKRGAKQKKTKKQKVKSRGKTLVREVRYTEINDDGEEEEIVTYVKVAVPSASSSRRKRKKKGSKKPRKMRNYRRRARTVSSVSIQTVKKRLAKTLGMHKPRRDVPLLVPTMKNTLPISGRAALVNSRYQSGISQVNLFGNNLSLDYSPPGSDEEFDSAVGNGPIVSAQPRSAVSATRRRIERLKGIANPLDRTDQPGVIDLVGSIISSQELWHSKMCDMTLKADGTLLVKNENKENKHSVNNNESPIKEKKEIIQEKEITPKSERPLDLTNVNPSDITQAPMYNNSRGGGNRGNFRGGYRDGGHHSHGGQGYGGRDSYAGGGRHSYGGPGPRDNFGGRDFGPPVNYNPNFEHRGPPPFSGSPPFRNRNPQHFRNERPRLPPTDRPPFPLMDGAERLPFHYPERFPRPRGPLNVPGPPMGMMPNPSAPMGIRPPPIQNNIPPNYHDDFSRNFSDDQRESFSSHVTPESVGPPQNPQDEEECDIYCDIETPNKSDSDAREESQNDSAIALLPPPEPPSGLLDFEGNSASEKDNDSDQELVIDDTPKEDTSKELKSDDKYDPFAADSDSNESSHGNKAPVDKPETCSDNNDIPIPLEPPPLPANFPALNVVNQAVKQAIEENIKPVVRLTAYDDDDDEDSQADCPNFSIYSSETMDVVRHTEQELSQQIGPLQPPPLPPDMPDDDDIIVGDVQPCDLADIPEPSDPYVEALQKERQTLSRIPPKKISNDSRGKITFKIGNKLKLNNKLSNLYDELDENIESTIEQEKQMEDKMSRDAKQNNKKPLESDLEKSEKASIEISTDKDESGTKNKSEIFNESDNKSDEEDEEKLQDLEKQLKEKERKLREIEQQEEMEKQMDNQSPLQDREALLEEELEHEMSSKMKNDNKRNSSLTDSSQNNNADSCLEKDTASKECSSTNSKCIVSTIDLTEKSSDTIISIADTIQMSPKNTDNDATRADHRSDENRESDEARTSPSECGSGAREPDNWDQLSSSKGHFRNKSKSPIKFANEENDFAEGSRRLSDSEDKSSEKGSRAKTASESEDLDNSDPIREKGSSSFDADDDSENFPLEKDKTDICTDLKRNIEPSAWESDGAYTPCKDELPVKGQDVPPESLSPFESGLEPITPTRDKVTDDLDGCRTPAGYAGLGTEAISETDEPMNFEDELALLTMRKEKEMEEGEIMDESKSNKKVLDKVKEKEEDSKKKKKKDKKEKGKDADKNKENIATENQVAWKKISKSTKERQYRDKDRRSKSKDKDKEKEKEKEKQKKKPKEAVKKKEKRKELPRYDVRKIVAEKPPRPRKDEYGRDIREDSRSRSKSRSLSHRRSTSRDRRSRSYSRMRSRSRSRSRVRRSWSKDRQSHSRPCRSLSRRRSISRLRRKSPRRRSSSKRRSLSRKRSVSRRRSRSLSRRRRSLSPRRRSGRRSLSRKRRTRSRSREKRKDKSKKRKSRSRSRNRKNSRSKSPKRASSRSREKKHTKRKRVSRSRSKERSSSRERDRNRNWDQVNEKPVERERNLSREREERRSWSAQWTPSWSRSRSKSPAAAQHDEIASHTWSPPPVLDNVAVPPKNLTVILTNKEAIKKKKKEKRKESKKSRETEKRKKNKRNRTPPPSKEVFASGDNILVSVCFNKDNETNQPELPEIPETLPLLVPTKRKRREPVHVEPPKRPKKDKTKDKRSKSPKAKKEKKKKSKAAEIAATKKPVAVIDLDQSPFREQTPSPRDIIVLSDDDDKQVQESATPEQRPSSQATPQHEQFVSQGPKTPPEPQVKFSITKQTSNLRTSMINPLHEEEEEEEEEIDERAEEELEMRAQEELELRLKVGPNTPPEPPSSPPTSPDVYDPFDPTKSRSPTPVVSQEATPTDERDRSQRNSPRKHDATDTPLMPSEPVQQLDQPNQEKQVEKPKIISMVTIKRASPKRDSSPAADNQTEASQPADSPTKSQPNQQNVQSAANPFATINPVLATVAAAVQRSTIFATSTPITGQRNLLQPNRISPSNQTKQRTNDRPQLPNLFTNPAKSTPVRSSKSTQNKSNSSMGQNGSDTTLETTSDAVDMSSPYSPGSSLSDGIFDPPSPGNYNSPSAPAASTNKNSTSKTSKPMEKKDAFDALFGTSPAVKTMGKGRSKKVSDKDKRKKSTNPKVGVRMDENQLQILDDLPSSAVEMQVKDKFLKKLNRQERVVEEVKLVLKPHYTKKHVTKEEYKDIMRKAVPKICHNKTGEINPKKIAQLIEAYVKKCRGGKKKTPGVSTNTSAKVSKPAKTLWS